MEKDEFIDWIKQVYNYLNLWNCIINK
jgi:hypothetical protein